MPIWKLSLLFSPTFLFCSKMAIIMIHVCKMSWRYLIQSMKFVTQFFRWKLWRVIYWVIFYKLNLYISKLLLKKLNNYIWFKKLIFLHQSLLIMSAGWGALIQSPICLSPQFLMRKIFFSLRKTLFWGTLEAHKNSPILVRFWPIAKNCQLNPLHWFS